VAGFPFPEHTLESAPPASRRIMAAMARQRGRVPAGVGRLASSPQLLDGFLKASGLFESSSLDPVAREVVILTIAARNGCHICVAMHTAKLAAFGYTAQNALEVVLGIGAYTMSTLANRMTRAPLDEELRAFAWEEPAAVT